MAFDLNNNTSPPAYLFSATVTRPNNTNAYAANDVYGGAFELVSVGTAPSAGSFIILTDIVITWSMTTVPSGMSSFVFFPYSVTPPSAIPDNGTWGDITSGAFSTPAADKSSIIYPSGFTINARSGQATNINTTMRLTGSSFFAYLVTAGAFTPAAGLESFTVRVRALAA